MPHILPPSPNLNLHMFSPCCKLCRMIPVALAPSADLPLTVVIYKLAHDRCLTLVEEYGCFPSLLANDQFLNRSSNYQALTGISEIATILDIHAFCVRNTYESILDRAPSLPFCESFSPTPPGYAQSVHDASHGSVYTYCPTTVFRLPLYTFTSHSLANQNRPREIDPYKTFLSPHQLILFP